jgi:hypothetical protein
MGSMVLACLTPRSDLRPSSAVMAAPAFLLLSFVSVRYLSYTPAVSCLCRVNTSGLDSVNGLSPPQSNSRRISYIIRQI